MTVLMITNEQCSEVTVKGSIASARALLPATYPETGERQPISKARAPRERATFESGMD